MDSKKKLKRSKQDAATDPLHTPQKSSNSSGMTGCDLPDGCGSPDFMGSQECFTVGWDWSSHITGHRKPTIRVVERPAQKKNDGNKLLECSRPRRLVRNRNVDNCDDSVFVNELKSLAAGCKGFEDTTSPVASPPSFRRKKDVLVTPTSLRESMRRSSCSKSVESANCSTSQDDTGKESTEEGRGSLDELLDDSLGADLLKFTQDIEQGLKQTESKTPKPLKVESNILTSAKRKNRLSLSSKKVPTPSLKGVCRRINDVYEENIEPGHEPQAKLNNNNVSTKIEFDDLDEDVMLTLEKLEEEEFVKSKDAVSPEENARTSKVAAKAKGAIFEEEDDDFVSPDLLDLIDVWEKKATQEREKKKQDLKSLTVKKSPTKNVLNNKAPHVRCDKSTVKESSKPSASNSVTGYSSGNLNKQSERLSKEKRTEIQQPPKKTLCLDKAKTVCTPEEIEKKRQDAKKRLQLKKKSQ